MEMFTEIVMFCYISLLEGHLTKTAAQQIGAEFEHVRRVDPLWTLLQKANQLNFHYRLITIKVGPSKKTLNDCFSVIFLCKFNEKYPIYHLSAKI